MLLKKTANLLITTTACFFVFAQSAYSAQVTQVKNGKVMIDNQGEEIEIGQDYYLLNVDNKKTAIVQITAVKNGKSIATITKGKASGDETLELKGSSSKGSSNQSSDSDSSSASPKFFRYNTKKVSVVLNLFSNSMTAKESDGGTPAQIEDVSMKGSSFGVTGIIEMPMNSWFTLRGTLGYEPFKTEGTASINGCDNATSKNCTAEMSYLSVGAYGRYDFYKTKALLTWAALGATTKLPISKTSTALKTDDIKMTATYGLALGVDYFISNKAFIPFSIEQQSFMASDTVKASLMAIRIGYGLAY